jgi:hypothetical protein
LAVAGIEEVSRLAGVIDIVVTAQPGELLEQPEHGGQRAGCLVTEGADRDEALSRADDAEKRLQWKVEL